MAPTLRLCTLLCALLCASLASAARTRQLTQTRSGAPGAAPTPAPAPGPMMMASGDVVQTCIDLTSTAGAACTTESDTVALIFPRSSEQLPTSDQIASALSMLKASAAPSAACCEGLLPYVQFRCPCVAGYQQLLPVGGFDKSYFIGTTYILSLACNQDFPQTCPAK